MGDYFSRQAADYSRYRPDYPPALYNELLKQVPQRGVAWDCGTGNGQVARVLAEHFDQVVATDISASQLAQANAPENVRFAVAAAENPPADLPPVDLITVAQAVHWFDLDLFWQACGRVAGPASRLAYWTYGLASAQLPDGFERWYHRDVVGPYWPPGREHVDNLYQHIQPPFRLVSRTVLSLRKQWTMDDYLGYLSSWSATQRYREQTGEDPIVLARQRLLPLWGRQRREVVWPLVLFIYALGE